MFFFNYHCTIVVEVEQSRFNTQYCKSLLGVHTVGNYVRLLYG